MAQDEISSEPSKRDIHLFGPGPKTILSLDGGGVRGAVSLAFLERLEQVLESACGRAVKLSEVFDFIGGTSTGAIIATGLALGYTARQMREFYADFAPRVFRRSHWRVIGWQAKFDARHLRDELHRIIGNRSFDTPDLETGLCVITKRLDTGSAWIISNNPRSPFWDHPADKSYLGNRSYSIATVVRASTAAPSFFDPEIIEIMSSGEAGLFVDGAVTPYNNPALSLLMLCTLPQHGIGWTLGVDNLTLVSVGTGSFRAKLSQQKARRSGAIGLAVSALAAMISDNQRLTLGLTQALGHTRTPWIINSEVGSMTGLSLPGGPLFETLRYDIELETDWLRRECGRDVDERVLKILRRLDDPRAIEDLHALASAAAAQQIKLEHLGSLLKKIDPTGPSNET